MPESVERQILAELRQLADPVVASNRTRFFKAGPGEYGEGDVFRGLTVPQIRDIEKQYRKVVDLDAVLSLLASTYHEDRLLALLLMNHLYGSGDQPAKQAVFEAYLENTIHINNWDLVDSSSRFIIGPHAETEGRQILYDLAQSENMWERRIAVVATYHLIKKGDIKDILRLAEILMEDQHDLIQKAVGWMLREAGKQSRDALISFLESYAHVMPRTMLRYSLEKFPKETRSIYMARRNEYFGPLKR